MTSAGLGPPDPTDDDLAAAEETPVDPDLDAARGLDPSGSGKGLTTDELRPEEEVVEFEPPNRASEPTRHRRTTRDETTGTPLDTRLAQEEPDQ